MISEIRRIERSFINVSNIVGYLCVFSASFSVEFSTHIFSKLKLEDEIEVPSDETFIIAKRMMLKCVLCSVYSYHSICVEILLIFLFVSFGVKKTFHLVFIDVHCILYRFYWYVFEIQGKMLVLKQDKRCADFDN